MLQMVFVAYSSSRLDIDLFLVCSRKACTLADPCFQDSTWSNYANGFVSLIVIRPASAAFA